MDRFKSTKISFKEYLNKNSPYYFDQIKFSVKHIKILKLINI